MPSATLGGEKRVMDIQYKNPHVFWHDRLLAKTVLPLIPRRVRPNHVTTVRLLFTPVVVWLLYKENYAWGVPAFVLVAFTDAIDGAMARTRDQITKWGIVFDPIADKLLVGGVLIVIVLMRLSFYLGIAIILVESIVALAGLYSHRINRVYMANYLGKWKMVLQVTGLFFLLLSGWLGGAVLHQTATVILAVSLLLAIANIVTFGLRRAI